MVKTFGLTADVPPDQVRIVLPDDVPSGSAAIVVVVSSHAGTPHTLKDLAQSPLFGMWRNRDDIGGNAEFARRCF